MVQMGRDKSNIFNISTMELGDTVSERTRPTFQILYRFRCFRSDFYGTHLPGAYIFAF